MRRILLLVILGVLGVGLLFAEQPPSLTRINFQGWKSMEGGIAVNPVTHKVYIIAEQATEDADNQKAVFVLNNESITAQRVSKKVGLPRATANPLKVIPILTENEYITVDPVRNLIYVGTKFSVEQDSAEAGDDGESEIEPPGSEEPPDLLPPTSSDPVPVTVGTLTVIDGNTDTVVGIYYFAPGIEPEGVAVDPASGIVYLGAKAPEGEAADDGTCTSGTPIPDIAEPSDVECWTAGSIYAFQFDPQKPEIDKIKLLGRLLVGDDPESIVFESGMVYAANEDDGTVSIATALTPCKISATGWCGLELITDEPLPPDHFTLEPFYDLWAFNSPNHLGCLENQYEADKMAAGGGSVFITDDRSRVSKITATIGGAALMGTWEVPGATVCEEIPNTDGGGLNTANNIAFMQKYDNKKLGDQVLYVVSEQNTVAIFDPATMILKATITIPGARHLDGIATDAAANRVWITDEELQAVFVLQGACANGTGTCAH